jgi:hypothetical protein
MKPALDHHYAMNSHHPEHFATGIQGMSLLDVLEMLCDWKAATLRHNDGDIRRSIELNQKRFGYSDELKAILLNTLAVVEGNTRPVPQGQGEAGAATEGVRVWNPKQVMPKVDGKSFRCTECGCNVFTEDAPLKFECNGCGVRYEGELSAALGDEGVKR